MPEGAADRWGSKASKHFCCKDICLPQLARERPELLDVLRARLVAARDAKVEHFVYTSALAARENHPIDFFRTKHEIEEGLRDSHMPYTILRPAAFMEQHVHGFIGKPLLHRWIWPSVMRMRFLRSRLPPPHP